MKIDEIGGTTYNFGCVGIKCVMNISYDIPSKSKTIFFCFNLYKLNWVGGGGGGLGIAARKFLAGLATSQHGVSKKLHWPCC